MERLTSSRKWIVLRGFGHDLSVDPKIVRTEDYIRTNFKYAGVLPMTPDGSEIILGGHEVDGSILWGPFAGGRISGEEAEQTALREAEEETGGYVFKELLPPTVIVKATSMSKIGIGVIFPVIVTDDVKFIPNSEVSCFKSFRYGDVMELMDFELDVGADYMLWGSVYSWALLDLWLRCNTPHSKWVNDPDENVMGKMNRIVSVEASLGESFYEQLKRSNKLA